MARRSNDGLQAKQRRRFFVNDTTPKYAGIVGGDRLIWRKDQGGFVLHFGQRLAPLIRVVADSTYADMWRIALADGSVSDMCNLSRARDAAVASALRSFNKLEVQETLPERHLAPQHKAPPPR